MAVVPLSATSVRLLSGVPLYKDYKHTRWFATKSEQTTYFTSRDTVYVKDNRNFQRIKGAYFVSIDKHQDELWNVNYLMFQNKDYGNKWFYAFVTGIEYENRSNTYVHFEIDVLQTWRFDIDIKPSFVKREHCKLWNSDGSPVINTLDEGVDFGNEYDIVDIEQYRPYKSYMFLVVAMKTRADNPPDDNTSYTASDFNTITPTNVGTVQPLNYYIMPFNPVLAGNTPNMSIDGTSIEQPDSSYNNVASILGVLSSSEVAVNNIVSMYVTDNTGLDVDIEEISVPTPYERLRFSSSQVEVAYFKHDYKIDTDPIVYRDGNGQIEGTVIQMLRVKKAGNFSPKTVDLGNKYSKYKNVTESKLLMYPYTVLTVQDFQGNKVDYKNEYIESKKIEIESFGSLGTSNKVAYGVKHYLHKDITSETMKRRITYDNAMINDDPKDIPVIDDYASAYLQGNRNSLRVQRNQAMWNAFTGGAKQGVAGTSFGASSMYASRHGSELWQEFGRVAGALGAVNVGISAMQGLGDSVLAIQSINAKEQDARNTPPNLQQLGSNINFDVGYRLTGVHVIKRQIKPEYIKKLEDYFKMFGYKVHEVKKPNLTTRKHFNYVETESIVIHASINNDDLQEIKNCFDKGITLWHTNDIGNYNLANGVR